MNFKITMDPKTSLNLSLTKTTFRLFSLHSLDTFYHINTALIVHDEIRFKILGHRKMDRFTVQTDSLQQIRHILMYGLILPKLPIELSVADRIVLTPGPETFQIPPRHLPPHDRQDREDTFRKLHKLYGEV